MAKRRKTVATKEELMPGVEMTETVVNAEDYEVVAEVGVFDPAPRTKDSKIFKNGSESTETFQIMFWRYEKGKHTLSQKSEVSVGKTIANQINSFVRNKSEKGIADFAYLKNGNVCIVTFPSYYKKELSVA